MYCRGLGLRVLGSFESHQGFDGVMLGTTGGQYHFEFTRCRSHPVFYITALPDWREACANMLAAGFRLVASFNPYWDAKGRTYEDPDGYRIVLQNAAGSNVESS